MNKVKFVSDHNGSSNTFWTVRLTDNDDESIVGVVEFIASEGVWVFVGNELWVEKVSVPGWSMWLHNTSSDDALTTIGQFLTRELLKKTDPEYVRDGDIENLLMTRVKAIGEVWE